MRENNNAKTNKTKKDTIEKVPEMKIKNKTSPIPIVFLKFKLRNRVYKKLTPKIRDTNNKLTPKLKNAISDGTLYN